ncbi:abortive infection family protein [Anabaena sphaerica FACHB-251]|uniref:Abortive infection family protein n=1 Tax=Anabaena sphaerica FACHB-251 TaxID=2692883 RepID=A0A927A0Y5_9NOST|nr:abortive infection family protein [Anabaena sphaerica]MBD2294034.1 abortive infection family protein [Anabaena sphaerica FACHB-251]
MNRKQEKQEIIKSLITRLSNLASPTLIEPDPFKKWLRSVSQVLKNANMQNELKKWEELTPQLLHTDKSFYTSSIFKYVSSDQKLFAKEILLGFLAELSKDKLLDISIPAPEITSAVVELAINDVEILISTNGAVSGVDRIHTALHGYLRAVCTKENIPHTKDDSMTKLFKLLRQQHPAFQNIGVRSQDIEKILQSCAGIMDVLNPIRNSASLAHPNEDLLEKNEAMLVINVARTLLHYLDAKLK